MVTEVILSDGQSCSVRRLGLYELDKVAPPEVSGPYKYKFTSVTGTEYEDVFDPHSFDEPPAKPDTPREEVKERTAAWYDWHDYELYQAALAHENKRIQSASDYLERVAYYILEQCVSDGDAKRIVDEEDWYKVYNASVVPQLTKEVLARTLKHEFKAAFNNKEIFEALAESSGGLGIYDGIRLWENRLMIEMRMTELEYVMMPLAERARKVCAMMLNTWLEHLEIDRMRQKQKDKTDNG